MHFRRVEVYWATVLTGKDGKPYKVDIETYRNYCLQKQGVAEAFPFDQRTLVHKVAGRIFAITDVDEFNYINLKCAPDIAVQLREQHEEVTPGYHMNKKHWNAVRTTGNIPDTVILQWIDHSYKLVVEQLPKKEQLRLQQFLDTD